jgi:hypothetical protein
MIFALTPNSIELNNRPEFSDLPAQFVPEVLVRVPFITSV